MYQISKEWHFSAAHYLPKCHEAHPCRRLHGHNYIVRVAISARALHPVGGWIADYGEMDDAMQQILAFVDHENLNDLGIIPDGQTTAENLARWFFEKITHYAEMGDAPWWPHEYPGMASVTVCETPTTSATYWRCST